MDKCIECDYGSIKVTLVYSGRGIGDRGVPMNAVIKHRDPYMLINFDSEFATYLTGGTQKKVPSTLDGDTHSVYFGDLAKALEFLVENHPNVELREPDYY